MNESKYISTNIGLVPIEDYKEIVAIQNGFDSYENMEEAGYCILIERRNNVDEE